MSVEVLMMAAVDWNAQTKTKPAASQPSITPQAIERRNYTTKALLLGGYTCYCAECYMTYRDRRSRCECGSRLIADLRTGLVRGRPVPLMHQDEDVEAERKRRDCERKKEVYRARKAGKG
jgi:hypothetical protein